MTDFPQMRVSCLDTRYDDSHLTGFRFLWAVYVTGFVPTQHCKKCLRGPTSSRTSPQIELRKHFAFDEQSPGSFDYIYICGVSNPYQWRNSFHLPFRVVPGAVAQKDTYNGFRFRVTNAEEIEIPELPAGYRGLDNSFTTCRNFQFGVHAYGDSLIAGDDKAPNDWGLLF
jgi:hypothetical protein